MQKQRHEGLNKGKKAKARARTDSEVYLDTVEKAIDKMQLDKKKAKKDAWAAMPMSEKMSQTFFAIEAGA